MAATEKAYEAMINALKDYNTKVSRACEEMISAGNTCVANTDGDPAASSANAKLQSSVGHIFETLSQANRIVSAMQEELQEIQRAAALASSI